MTFMETSLTSTPPSSPPSMPTLCKYDVSILSSGRRRSLTGGSGLFHARTAAMADSASVALAEEQEDTEEAEVEDNAKKEKEKNLPQVNKQAEVELEESQ